MCDRREEGCLSERASHFPMGALQTLLRIAFSLFPQATSFGVGRGLEPPTRLHPGTHGCMLEVIFETSQTALGGSQGNVLWHGNTKVLHCKYNCSHL